MEDQSRLTASTLCCYSLVFFLRHRRGLRVFAVREELCCFWFNSSRGSGELLTTTQSERSVCSSCAFCSRALLDCFSCGWCPGCIPGRFCGVLTVDLACAERLWLTTERAIGGVCGHSSVLAMFQADFDGDLGGLFGVTGSLSVSPT